MRWAGEQRALFELPAATAHAPAPRRAVPPRQRRLPVLAESTLFGDVAGAIPMPATVAACEQRPTRNDDGTWSGGACLKLTCRHNVLVEIVRHERGETISMGAQRGGVGIKIPCARTGAARLTPAALERLEDEIVDAIVLACEELPSTCSLDYAADAELLPEQTDEDAVHMGRSSVGRVLGLSRERVRQIEDAALAKLRRAGV